MKNRKCIMVQGTMSNAGKSVLCAALCRIFKQDGYSVAPFKSQNMALNSYVTSKGLEMGRAQVMQAEASGIEPDARMNPILLKPSSDVGSQVIVLGEVMGNMSAKDYYKRKLELLPVAKEAFESLCDEYDIVVIEGAGSPAEINLRENDIVNMGFAEAVDAPVLLVGDIDRGGVFAQMYGTVELLQPEEKARIEGLVINKFRGDVDILTPGLDILEEKTGKKVLGVVPYIHADIDDEDSVSDRINTASEIRAVDIAVIRLPHISNFTDFNALEQHPALGVRYVDSLVKLGNPDMIVLPGTKSTISDLLWLRQCGLEAEILKAADRGVPILGICGGYQMLGESVSDPDHVEGEQDKVRGIGLLPCDTIFEPSKVRTRYTAKVTAGPFAGANVDGYEIHMGRTDVRGERFCILETGEDDGCIKDNVFGTYLHGLFDTGEMTQKLGDMLCERKGIDPSKIEMIDRKAYAQSQYDILADGVRAALDMKAIYEIMDRYANR
ncbi:MAG: cobyric acid synthase [Eubacteriaceae bacterium]|nr:cobyric acid synthase [Eubacteriaceae bacterium]MCR4893260.1 cobyric acid synthase [Eubacteriales bacterium]